MDLENYLNYNIVINIMQIVCEVFVKNYLPSVRALIAKRMKEKYSLTQVEVAKRMKTTQPAVSHYLREARGKRVKRLEEIDEIVQKIDEIIEANDVEILRKGLCDICKILRAKGLLCKDAEIDEKECEKVVMNGV